MMDKIFKLLGNFEEIEGAFWTEFTSIKKLLRDLGERQKLLIEKVDDLDRKSRISIEKIDDLDIKVENTRCCSLGVGKACHTGFLQIKEAMETLREELGEASGVLIEHTYNDGN